MRAASDIASVDLTAIIEADGVELRHGRGICPLHDKDGRNPSFSVKNNRFICWSCGESGDAVDYVRKRRGCSFPEALIVLGIDRPQATAEMQRELCRKRTERSAARWSESNLAWTLGKMIRLCHEDLRDLTPENLDEHALILTELETLIYQHDLLINGDKADRAELVRELAGLHLFSRRTLLFRRDFDCTAWARSLGRYQEPHNEPGSEPKAGCGIGN